MVAALTIEDHAMLVASWSQSDYYSSRHHDLIQKQETMETMAKGHFL